MEASTFIVGTAEDEIDSYLRGFGDARRARALLDAATVLIPLSADGEPYLSRVAGVDWLVVFTRVEQYSAYLHARDQEVGDYLALPGRLVVDELLPRLGDQVGLVINPAGDTPFAFPADALRACDD